MNAAAIIPPNEASITSVMLVSFQFSQKRTPSESASGHDAAYELDQARPTRFRMPSASVMMREISTPVLVESK